MPDRRPFAAIHPLVLAHATPPPGHRTDNARRRRQQTRARLLEATMALCDRPASGVPAVDDISEMARVSRSTFYNHFRSGDDALAALGEDLTRRHFETLHGRFQGVFNEPWKMQAVGLRLALLRSLQEPAWTRLLIRTEAWLREGSFSAFLREHLHEGRERGDFRILDLQAALDQLRGLLMQSMASLHRGVEEPTRYVDAAVMGVLQALGCRTEHCEEGLRCSRRIAAAAGLWREPRPA